MMIDAALDHESARLAYGRLGTALDIVSHYEDFATRRLIGHARLAQAESVFEFGCGTGRFAQRALESHLSSDASYTAFDVTPEMVQIAQSRVARLGNRVRIQVTDGSPPIGEHSASYDRFISNYVFDLLSEDAIRAVLAEAHRILRPGGLLCLSGLAPAQGALSRICMGMWSVVYKHRPAWVGGCRPITLLPFLDENLWRLEHHSVVVPLGFPLEVVIAEKRAQHVVAGDGPRVARSARA